MQVPVAITEKRVLSCQRRPPWFLVMAIFVVTFVFSWTSSVALARNYSPHSGYLMAVKEERTASVTDFEIFGPPPPLTPLRSRIFNDKLSREFTDRYEIKFGRTEQQRVYSSPNRHTYYSDLWGFRGTAEETDNEKRKFGEFMLRRLSEYHVENYAKNDPSVRPVWEVKEKISQVKMQIGSKVKFHAKYSISGNAIDIRIDNPWLLTKITMQMGSGGVEETIVSASRSLTPTVSLESHWYTTDGITSFIARKALTPTIGTSLTTSTFTHEHGKTQRESLYLAGVSYAF